MVNKLNRGFSQLREDELDNKADFIIASLTGNAAFPTTTPTLVAVQTSLTAYEDALAIDGSGRVAAIEATRADLENKLGQLAGNLELTPGVTDAQLATTGFEMRKPRTTTDAPVAAPQNVRLKPTGMQGEVQMLCDPVDRARSYQVQKAMDPQGTTWTDVGTFGSTRGVTIGGLERGKDIWVRVRAVGGNGPGAWSDPATTMVT
jgi:hypothetical protein